MGGAQHLTLRPQAPVARADRRCHAHLQPNEPEIRVGIHWRSGASEELTVLRPDAARHARSAATLDLLRELGRTHTNAQLAEHLNHAGHLTASGRPFDQDGVRWLRWRHRIPAPSPLAAHELGVHELAQRLAVGDHVIYTWIRHGKLDARRAGHRRLAIPFNDDIEATCRQRLANSPRTRLRTQQPAAPCYFTCGPITLHLPHELPATTRTVTHPDPDHTDAERA